MPAKIQRTKKNVEMIHGVRNPEYNPDPETPLIQLVVLSDNADPPQWSTEVEKEYVEFPSHAAAETRAREINEKYPWIYCYARVIPRDENELPPTDAIPLQPPLIPLRELAPKATLPEPEDESGKQQRRNETRDSDLTARLSDATPEHRLRTLRKLAKKKAKAKQAAVPAEQGTKKDWWREPAREVRLPYRDD
jgi:hypothetical protein